MRGEEGLERNRSNRGENGVAMQETGQAEEKWRTGI